jgi:hypothetical protein
VRTRAGAWLAAANWRACGRTGKDTFGAFGWAVHDGDLAPTAVPEPSTCALMVAGLLAVGVAAKRKRRF